MHRGRHPRGELGEAVEEAFRHAFGRSKRQRAAALKKVARALSTHSLAVERARATGGLESLPLDSWDINELRPATPTLDPGAPDIVAVVPSHGRAGGPFAGRETVLFVVRDARAALGSLPTKIRGFPVERVTVEQLESGQLGRASQSQQIAPIVASSRFGTITRAFARGGVNWVMTCSHVASPAGLGPDALVFETGFATVKHLTRVDPGTGACSLDVAIAATSSEVDDSWPDGRPFGGVVAPDSAMAPFTFFGVNHRSASFETFSPEASVPLDLATGGTVNFVGQHRFSLDGLAIEPGDSGGAVRDAQNRLLGLVVGRDPAGGGYFTPYSRVEAWLDGLGL
ncbi:MAG: trypsin-like peptidase domain-containing protein [Byssovorax sp.]